MNHDITQRVLARVQDSGGRITLPTRLVVGALAATEAHLTADDLIAEVERRAPGIAPSTIYRVLQRLDELGALEHVHSGAGAAFYHLHEHSHAHLVCTDCGNVTDLSADAADALHRFSAAVRTAHGFDVDPHHAAMLGRCAACSRKSVTDSVGGDELLMVRHT